MDSQGSVKDRGLLRTAVGHVASAPVGNCNCSVCVTASCRAALCCSAPFAHVSCMLCPAAPAPCNLCWTQVYLITELVTGGELLEAVLQRGTYSEAEARLAFVQLLKGIEYLHSK